MSEPLTLGNSECADAVTGKCPQKFETVRSPELLIDTPLLNGIDQVTLLVMSLSSCGRWKVPTALYCTVTVVGETPRVSVTISGVTVIAVNVCPWPQLKTGIKTMRTGNTMRN